MKQANKTNRVVMSRLTTIKEQGNRSFDIEFWQQMTDEQKMKAVWDLVIFDYELKGRNMDELRLQRTIENLRRAEG